VEAFSRSPAEGIAIMKRREFLQAGIAAIPLIGVGLPAGSFVTERPSLPLYKTIFDERFPGSVAFAAEMRRWGSPVHAIRADVTQIWYNDLYYRWRESPIAIAGMTTNRSLFCLDELARDAGLRVVHHADHRILADGSVDHEVFGVDGPQQSARLKDAGAHWGAEVANLIVSFLNSPRAGFLPIRKTADPLISTNDPQPLVSWVIAPVRPRNGVASERSDAGRTA
jgi:hypothetical protein